MISIDSLGQTDAITTEKRTAFRQMALQHAVSAVLKAAADLTPYPGRVVELADPRFHALVNLVVETANRPGWATNPGYTWTPAFTEAEAVRALSQVGYRSGLPVEVPVVVAAAPGIQAPRLPEPDTTWQVFVDVPGIQPAPSPPPILPKPVIPSPVFRPLLIPVPGAVKKAETRSALANPWIWGIGVAILIAARKKGR